MPREGLRVRELTPEEGNRLLRTVRRSSGSAVMWRRAQIVMVPAQRMDVAAIPKVVFTSPARVRDVINNFNDDGFGSLVPRYAVGRRGRRGWRRRRSWPHDQSSLQSEPEA